MMDMVEKVARALCEVAAGEPVTDNDWRIACSDRATMEAVEGFRAQARAAIEAMREPDDAMTAEGGDTPCGQFYPGSQAANIWRNMIDAALTPSPASK